MTFHQLPLCLGVGDLRLRQPAQIQLAVQNAPGSGDYPGMAVEAQMQLLQWANASLERQLRCGEGVPRLAVNSTGLPELYCYASMILLMRLTLLLDEHM